jgi:hypothetical protein
MMSKMPLHQNPGISPELAKRIRLVRRDVTDLLFHFTRSVHPDNESGLSRSASSVLRKILNEGKLLGSSRWTEGVNTICFTEAPIQEFNSIFSLASIAASLDQRPRYEPYGIAVSKKWLFEQGGRPVVYDHPDAIAEFSASQRYRYVPYDPCAGIDFTWEREWRVKSSTLLLDPKHTLVIVPTSAEAFELVYGYANLEADWDVEGSQGEAYITGTYHSPKWLAVSLDLFGLSFSE